MERKRDEKWSEIGLDKKEKKEKKNMETIKVKTAKTSGIRCHLKGRSGEGGGRIGSGVETAMDNNNENKRLEWKTRRIKQQNEQGE